jgi:hypothetical protein
MCLNYLSGTLQLSVDLHGKMALGEVKSSEKGICQRYKVTKFPTILVVKPGQKKPIKYEEKVNSPFSWAFQKLCWCRQSFCVKKFSVRGDDFHVHFMLVRPDAMFGLSPTCFIIIHV